VTPARFERAKEPCRGDGGYPQALEHPLTACDIPSVTQLNMLSHCRQVFEARLTLPPARPPVGDVESLVNAYSSVVVEQAHVDKAISAFPELAAALNEYIRDPNRPEGLYGFCDIGGGTIDGAIFRLNRAAGFPRLSIPSAAVRSLGCVYRKPYPSLLGDRIG
jgi:hypothetical protein